MTIDDDPTSLNMAYTGFRTNSPEEFGQMGKDENLPKSRKAGLIVQALDDELLVYDLERHKAHCLNRGAAAIWNRCDGETSLGRSIPALEEELGIPVDEQVIWLAINQLRSRHLLEERILEAPRVSRRQLLCLLGKVAGASLPLITSIVAPTAAQAASCAGLMQTCRAQADCCQGLKCVGNPHKVCKAI